MKRILFFIIPLIFSSGIYFACKKNDSHSALPDFHDIFVSEGVEYLKSSISSDDFNTLNFKSIQSITDSNNNTEAFIIPTLNKSESKSVFVTKKGDSFLGNWFTFDTVSHNNGFLRTSTFDEETKNEVTFVEGNPVKIVKDNGGKISTTLIKYPKGGVNQFNNIVISRVENGVQTTETTPGGTLPPVTVIAYITISHTTGYSLVNGLWSLYYISPMNIQYEWEYILRSPASGGNTSDPKYKVAKMQGGPGGIPTPIVYDDFYKCFVNNPASGYTYKVTVCVDQPIPNNRSPWSFSPTAGVIPSDATHGHAFLILEETLPNGTIIRRSVGFYPNTKVTPTNPTSDGKIMDDTQYKQYEVALTTNVTNSQFFSLINYARSFIPFYDLNTKNSVNFVISACASGGISLPSTIGSWPGGSGVNAGDLGEDIRNMTLTSSQTRTTLWGAHSYTGTCN